MGLSSKLLLLLPVLVTTQSELLSLFGTRLFSFLSSIYPIPSHSKRREAWEEVGLPIDPEKAPKICELRTFLSANELVVSTIVVLLLDPSVKVRLSFFCSLSSAANQT